MVGELSDDGEWMKSSPQQPAFISENEGRANYNWTMVTHRGELIPLITDESRLYYWVDDEKHILHQPIEGGPSHPPPTSIAPVFPEMSDVHSWNSGNDNSSESSFSNKMNMVLNIVFILLSIGIIGVQCAFFASSWEIETRTIFFVGGISVLLIAAIILRVSMWMEGLDTETNYWHQLKFWQKSTVVLAIIFPIMLNFLVAFS